MSQSLARNSLQVALPEFLAAMKTFSRRRIRLGQALLAFEGGFLSIESGEATAVMRAAGEWHGRASFAPEILRALAKFPPVRDPVMISYADGHLLIETMTIPCYWRRASGAFIRSLEAPGLIDLLALERTLPRADIKCSELGKSIRSAQGKAERRIRNAAVQLAELEISEADIRALVEARIAGRMERNP